MKLFGWFQRGHDNQKARRRWHEAWAAAVAAEDPSAAAALRSELDAMPRQAGDDVEVELEMLEGLERIEQLKRETAGGVLPIVETHHRVVAGDACHFTAPTTLPDDPAQASGRLLFTSARCIFVGGGRPQPVAWHSVREVIQTERDLLLVRADGTAAMHLRFNTFGDAVAAAFLARRLKGTRATRTL